VGEKLSSEFSNQSSSADKGKGMKIEVTSIRLVDPNLPSGLRGFADIKLDDILIRDFRIVQRNGKPSVEGAHTTFKKDGQIRFNQIVNFPGELKARVDTAILAAYFREKEKESAARNPASV
jgi:DNA-binding cell septation regulator SpoVG